MPRRTAHLLLIVALAASALGCRSQADQDAEQAPTGDAAAAAHAGTDQAAGTNAGAAGAAASVAAAQAGTGAAEGAPGPRGLLASGAADAARDPGEAAGLAARRAARLAAARAMLIDPEKGGTYRSADGRMEITVPPGALATGGTLRFWPVDTARLPEGPAGVPGLAIDGDWGGAKFQPGAKVRFKAPVDERFMKRIAALGGDPTALGISRDAQGRTYLEVTMTADERARPASTQQSKVGSGSLTEVAQLPVVVTGEARKRAEAEDRDPPPTVPAGKATLAPLAVDDPVVARWPGAPADSFHGPAFKPVRYIERAPQRVEIRESLAATVAGDPAMVTCAASECAAPPLEPLAEALRLNAGISSRRQYPEALRARAANPDLGCPP